MKTKLIPRRYAQRLFLFAKDRGAEEQYLVGLIDFYRLIEQNIEIFKYLNCPIIDISQRKETVRFLSQAVGIPKELIRFLCLLVEKQRIKFLKEIISCYQQVMDEYFDRLRVDLISAFPLSKEDMEELKKKFQSLLGKEILFSTDIDTSLIGGFVAKWGGFIMDFSIKHHLEEIKKIGRSHQWR